MRDTRLLVIFFLFSFSFVFFVSFFCSFLWRWKWNFYRVFFLASDYSNFSRPKLGIFEVSLLFINVNERNDDQTGETKQIAASWVRAYSANIQTRFSPKRSSIWKNLIPRFPRNFTWGIVFFFWSQHDFGNALYNVFRQTRVFVQVSEIEFQSSPRRFSLQ